MAKRKPRQRASVLLPELPRLPEVRRFPVRPRGPRVLQPLLKMPEEAQGPGPVPLELLATLPEWRVLWWLQKHGYNPDFQSSMMGGRQTLGGMVVDVILRETVPPTALRIQGLAWHYGAFADRLKDQRQKDQLTNMGYRVIDLDEDDIMERLDYVMRLALQGIDISRGVWGR